MLMWNDASKMSVNQNDHFKNAYLIHAAIYLPSGIYRNHIAC